MLLGGVYIALWLSAWFSASLLDSLGVVSLIFLPAGLRFFCLLVLGWRGVVLELTVQSVFALLQFSPWVAAPLSEFLSTETLWRFYDLLASLVANAAVILPLRRLLRQPWDFCRPAHTALFLAAALAASTLSALAHVYHLLNLGAILPTQFSRVLASWLIGDFIAIITLTPLLLFRLAPGLDQYLQHGRWPHRNDGATANAAADRETVLIVLAALLLLFGIPWSLNLHPHFPLIALTLLLPLTAIALRHGLRGALLAVVLLDSGLVVLIALFDQHGQALNYQAVMIAVAFIGLWFGGMVDARSRLMVRYRDHASVSNDLFWETDKQGRLIETSGRLAKRFEPLLGQSWRSVLSDTWQPQLTHLENARAAQQPFRHLEIAMQCADEAKLWIALNGLPLFDQSGTLTGYRGTAVDISRSRQAEELVRNYNETLLAEVAERTRELRQSHGELEVKERHLEVVLAAVPVGVLEIDENQCCSYINANGCALTGYSLDEAQGRPILDFIHPDDRAHVNFVWQLNRQNTEVHWIEFRLERTGLRCAAHWIALYHPELAADGAIMVLSNATARSQQDERLWTLAHHDALTDLPNRNLYWDRTRQALLNARRRDSGAALLWIDLDGFKAVNDSLGHAAGDALLQQVALRLTKRIRETDTVARMGGDEFAVIMPDITCAKAALHAATLVLASLAEPFSLDQGTAQISASIGIALYPQHAQSAEALTQCADVAMYEAKSSGRNTIHLWNSG
jgi:diguanylate cyclase (GGDEF)-like protein/PAS domain S-box-containing protein